MLFLTLAHCARYVRVRDGGIDYGEIEPLPLYFYSKGDRACE